MPFALSRPAAWYGINIASRVDPKLMKLTRGRVNLGGDDLPTLLLTRAAARAASRGPCRSSTSRRRRRDPDGLELRPGETTRLVHNVKANRDVTLTAGGVTERYLATEAEGPERDALYEKAKQLYSGYGVYEERTAGIRRVPVLRLTLAG